MKWAKRAPKNPANIKTYVNQLFQFIAKPYTGVTLIEYGKFINNKYPPHINKKNMNCGYTNR